LGKVANAALQGGRWTKRIFNERYILILTASYNSISAVVQQMKKYRPFVFIFGFSFSIG
jgi:hypothetical protein